MGCTMDVALERAQVIARYLSHCDRKYIIHIIMKEAGLDSSRDGFAYAKAAAGILYENPTATLSNGVYMAAGMLYNPPAGEKQVENAIHKAIEAAWRKERGRIWCVLFPGNKSIQHRCPSNKEFLAAVVDFVELWEGFAEEVRYEKEYV